MRGSVENDRHWSWWSFGLAAHTPGGTGGGQLRLLPCGSQFCAPRPGEHVLYKHTTQGVSQKQHRTPRLSYTGKFELFL